MDASIIILGFTVAASETRSWSCALSWLKARSYYLRKYFSYHLRKLVLLKLSIWILSPQSSSIIILSWNLRMRKHYFLMNTLNSFHKACFYVRCLRYVLRQRITIETNAGDKNNNKSLNSAGSLKCLKLWMITRSKHCDLTYQSD